MAAQPSSLDNLMALMQLTTGKGNTTTTSGGLTTKSEKTDIDQDTLNKILKSGLEGTQGLAAVASGQRTAGMYNSTTNTMLTNDLLARLSTQAAVAGAPKISTVEAPKTTTQVTTPKAGGGSLLAVGGMSLAKNQIDGYLKGKKLTDLLPSLTKSGSSGVDVGAIPVLGDAPMASAAISDVGVEAALGDAPMAGGLDFDMLSSVADKAVSAISDSVSSTLLSSAGVSLDALGTLGDAAMSSGGEQVIESVVESAAEDAAESAAGSWCFLTTAVTKYQGKSDKCFELETLRHYRDTWLKDNHPEDIEIYYREAPALVEKLESKAEREYLFSVMYQDYILPAVDSILSEDYKGAYMLYRQLYEFCKAV